MSKCMTIDETIDQNKSCTEKATKVIVELILEEALLSAFISSDKGCSRIGDFNIADEFRQQYDQLSSLIDFERVKYTEPNQESFPKLGENVERLHTTAENLESILDSFVKEEKVKPVVECTVVTEEVLADHELQIANGKIHLGTNRNEDFLNEKQEKVEIENYNEEKLSTVNPLNASGVGEGGGKLVDAQRPFQPFTTEDLRKSTLEVWDNENCSLVGTWEGDVATQREEAVKLMKTLSSVQVFSDPNRPRACAVAEEDVKKMTKEIEEINFTPSRTNSEASETVHVADGQGDAESKSFLENPANITACEYKISMDIVEEDQSHSTNKKEGENKKFPNENIEGEQHLEYEVAEEECLLKSRVYNESTVQLEKSADELFDNWPDIVSPLEDAYNIKAIASSLSYVIKKDETEKDIFANDSNESGPSNQFVPESVSLSGNVGSLMGSKQDDLYLKNIVSTELETTAKEWPSLNETNFLDEPKLFGVELKTLDLDLHVGESRTEVALMNLHTSEEKMEGYIETQEYKDFSQKSKTLLHEHQNEPEVLEQPAVKNKSGTTVEEQTNNVIVIESAHGETKDHDPVIKQSETEEETTEESGSSNPSLTQQDATEGTSAENETSDSSERPFRLHSPKMYLGHNFETSNQPTTALTESKEAIIDETESVIQIIEPPAQDSDSDEKKISFSLLNEIPESESRIFTPENSSSESDNPKRVFSGMTTVGPIKNVNYDPKDLTAPDIDFGKMTRITSSIQLAKDLNLLGSELTNSLSVKIIEEDDSDESLNNEDDRLDRTSLINRDIASLTKVQKVREVMSHQPKPEEDFEDEEALPRSRLDLKDVESMTDERYKGPDVGIPLLSFELGDVNLEAEKELVETMGLVISGFTNPAFYEEDFEEDKYPPTPADAQEQSVSRNEEQSSPAEAENVAKETDEPAADDKKEKKESEEGNEFSNIDISSSRHEGTSDRAKCSTLGSAFKKTSNKFLRKNVDLYMRNSKSLPRNSHKIATTESFRSLLDECQTSAATVLKKSRSLLKNTQTIFKSLSQSRVPSEKDSESNTREEKISSLVSDAKAIERKLSNFLKKEDFNKAKTLIKNKVEKTFKTLEKTTRLGTAQEIKVAQEKELQVVVRPQENFQIERMENFQSLLPKNSLVYKSQFVKNQEETTETTDDDDVTSEFQKIEEKVKIPDNSFLTEVNIETPQEIDFLEKNPSPQWLTDSKITYENLEQPQPDFIVMETIQGLPTTDLDKPSSDKDNLESITERSEDEEKTTMTSERSQKPKEPEERETDDEKGAPKTPSEKKIKSTKKKFSARFRSFWSSAFGRVKKGDLS